MMGRNIALPETDYTQGYIMNYEAPKTTVIGSITDLTRADLFQAGNDGQWPHLIFGDGGS